MKKKCAEFKKHDVSISFYLNNVQIVFIKSVVFDLKK